MKSTAFLVGGDDKKIVNSYEVAKDVEFLSIKPLQTLDEVEQQTIQTPVCFFLFEQVPNITVYESVIKEIRSCKRHNIRFFPLVYLCEEPSPLIIRQCITMGLDDVIADPFDSKKTKKRLLMQFNRETTYFETPSFFGPDRRRHADHTLSKSTIMRGKEKCLQIKFVRTIKSGISIFSRIVRAT